MNVFNLNLRKLSHFQSAWNQLLYWKGVSDWILEKSHCHWVMWCVFVLFCFKNPQFCPRKAVF